jgi:adenine/guanine phosphoribosyltransferase-like PRPP-binding protein
VLTTGATLSACGRALRDAGAERVDGVALARVVDRSYQVPQTGEDRGPSAV